MDLIKFRDTLIDDAIVSVERFETRPNRRRGCLRGLEIARKMLNAEQYTRELEARHQMEELLRVAVRDQKATVEEYWEFRTATAQVEFVYERMKVAYGCPGPLSARAVLDYVRIAGENM